MSDTKEIQQFWYTWSEFGYGGLSGGYRIRAVSEELADIRSERVRTLDKYARYSLPNRTDLYDPILEQGKRYYNLALTQDTSPYNNLLEIEGAPVSLSLVKTQPQDSLPGERILVNKVYTGKDKFGRPGTFFVHILASLPTEFTAKDAIALWRSNTWQTFDPPPQVAGLVIEAKSVDELKADAGISRGLLKAGHDPALNDFLRFVIHAYLQQQDEEDEKRQLLQSLELGLERLQKERASLSGKKELAQWQKDYDARAMEYRKIWREEPRRIYIAAKADWVAYFIAKLTEVLPPALLESLTFSTYEKEPEKSQCLLIGTCLPPSSRPVGAGIMARDILPRIAYDHDHALNCYLPDGRGRTGERQVVPYAADYALDAVQLLAHNPKALKKLLADIEKNFKKSKQALNVKSFLLAYHINREQKEKLTEQGTVIIFTTHTYLLDDPDIWDKIFVLIILNPAWFERTLKKSVAALIEVCETDIDMKEMMAIGRERAVFQLVESAKKQKREEFRSLMRFLRVLSPIASDPGTWEMVLVGLLSEKQTRQFVLDDEDLHTMLLAMGARAYPDPDQERLRLLGPLLIIRPTSFSGFVEKLRQDQGDLPRVWKTVLLDTQLELVKKHADELEGVRAEWAKQKFLLEEAKACFVLPDARAYLEAVKPILQVNEGNFGKLLALGLPPAWNEIATHNFTRQIAAMQSISGLILEDLEQHASEVQAVFHAQLSSPDLRVRQEIKALYWKLAQSHYTHMTDLLGEIHDMYPVYVSRDEVRAFVVETPLTPSDAYQILLAHHEMYKQENLEDLLTGLFARSMADRTLSQAQASTLLFVLLDKTPVRLETLESLLKTAQLNIGEIEAFFAQYGERYIRLYPKQSPMSPMLHSLNDNLILNNSTYKMTTLDLWLKSAHLSSHEQAQLIRKTCRVFSDYVWVMTHYAMFYFKAGQPDLEELCLEYFEQIVTSPEYAKLKKEILFPLVDANLRENLREQLILKARLTGRDRDDFVRKYGRAMPSFFCQSPATLGLYAQAITAKDGLSSAEKIALLSIRLGDPLTVEELERVLSISELVDGDAHELAQLLEQHGTRYCDLYLRNPPDQFAKSTLQRCILAYLSNFTVEGFETREATLAFLRYLTTFPTSWQPEIQPTAAGWLDFEEFLAASSPLTQDGMSKLESIFQKLFKGQFISTLTRVQYEKRLAHVIESSISSTESNLSSTEKLLVSLTRMERFATKQQKLNILRDVCASAGQHYVKTRDVNVLLPYIELIPRLPDIALDAIAPYAIIPGEQAKHPKEQDLPLYKMWDILLQLPDIRPEMFEQVQKEMFAQIDAHIQHEEKLGNWNPKIAMAWEQYLNDRFRVNEKVVVDEPGPVPPVSQFAPPALQPILPMQQPVLPVPQFVAPVPQPIPPAPVRSVAIVGSPQIDSTPPANASAGVHPVRWLKEIVLLTRMKRALRNRGRDQVERAVKMWQKYHDVLPLEQQMAALGEKRWNKLILLRDFSVVCKFADQPHVLAREPLLRYGCELAILGRGEAIKAFASQSQRGVNSILNSIERDRVSKALRDVDQVREIYKNRPDSLVYYSDVSHLINQGVFGPGGQINNMP